MQNPEKVGMFRLYIKKSGHPGGVTELLGWRNPCSYLEKTVIEVENLNIGLFLLYLE